MRKALVLVLSFIYISSFCQGEIDSLLKVLDNEILISEKYVEQKQEKLREIKNLKLTAPTLDSIYGINTLIYDEYTFFQFDSVLKYLDENIELANEINSYELILESTFNMVRNLCLNGRGAEAFDLLSELDRNKIPQELIAQYYIAHYNVYDRILEKKYNSTNKQHYQQLQILYYDSIVNFYTDIYKKYNSLFAYAFLKQKDYQKALDYNNIMLAQIKPEEKYYASLYFYRAGIYRTQNKNEEAKKYYAISAIANIRNAEKNNASLSELAKILFEEGKIEQANRYINFAMEDALFFNSPYRFIHLSNILPIINDAYQLESNRQKRNLKIFGSIATVLSLLLIIAVVFILKQLNNLSRARNEIRKNNTKLRELNEELTGSNHSLKESNLIKERYIANFLKICSDNIDKLDDFRKAVNKNILNQKADELLKKTKSRKMIDKEVKEFYHNFDETFLSIYPNFVEKLNALLLPKEAIELKKDELLNTELRVYALIRLGINDSVQIAELLRYSKHTIYNYRVKVRNKAIGERDDLENKVMEIGASF